MINTMIETDDLLCMLLVSCNFPTW